MEPQQRTTRAPSRTTTTSHLARGVTAVLLASALGSAGCAMPYVRGGRLHYPRVRDEDVQAYIPERAGPGRSAYLEAQRECTGIDRAYRALEQHGSDTGMALVLGVGISSIVLGAISGVTLTAASAEEAQRSVLELNPGTTTAAVQSSVDRQNALLWTGGITASLSGLLEFGSLTFWLLWQHNDARHAAWAEVREAVNESDRTVSEASDMTDAQLTHQAAILLRRCRRPQPGVPPLGTYLDGSTAPRE